jgi:hypothetical protein
MYKTSVDHTMYTFPQLLPSHVLLSTFTVLCSVPHSSLSHVTFPIDRITHLVFSNTTQRTISSLPQARWHITMTHYILVSFPTTAILVQMQISFISDLPIPSLLCNPPTICSTVTAGTPHLDSYSNLVGCRTLPFFSSLFSIHLLFTLSCSCRHCTLLLPLFFQDNACFSILFFVTFPRLYPRHPSTPPP